MIAALLDKALKAADIPIEGVSIGSPQDKTTWRVSPAAMQAAAQPIIDAFDLKADKWATLRERRDARLAASDWTQLADAPDGKKAAWAAYRQALRDLPAQTSDPTTPVWPPIPA